MSGQSTADGEASRSTSLRTLGRGTGGMLVGSAVTALTNFAIAVVVARLLSQQNAGVFFTGTALFALLYGTSRLAAGAGLVRFLAADRAVGVGSRISGLVRAALIPVVVFSALVAIALVLARQIVASEILGQPALETGAIVIWAALIPFAAVSDVLVSATRGFDRYAPAVVIEKIARPAAQLVATLLAANAGAAPAVIVVAWAAPYLGSAAWSWLWFQRLRANDGLDVPQDRVTPWSEFWRFNWAVGVGSWVQVILQRLDVILLSALRSPAEAAIYVAASRFLVLGQLIGNSFSLSLQPVIARYSRTGNTKRIREYYSISTAWLVLVSWPLYLGMIFAAPQLLGLFGEEYSSASGALAILASAMLIATAVGAVDQVLIMSGRPVWVLGNSLVALALNVAMNLLLIPQLGATGAALAWASSIVVSNLLPLLELVTWRRVHPFGAPLLLAVLINVLGAGTAVGMQRLLGGTDAFSVATSVGAATAVYCSGLWFGRNHLRLTESPLAATLPRRRR